MTITEKQRHLKESLRILKEHCLSKDSCEGCELEDICECLFDVDKTVENWKLD